MRHDTPIPVVHGSAAHGADHDDVVRPQDSDAVPPDAEARAGGGKNSIVVPLGATLAQVEQSMILATLEYCSGNKTRAAAVLGVSLKTLYNRLNQYRVDGSLDAGLDVDGVGGSA